MNSTDSRHWSAMEVDSRLARELAYRQQLERTVQVLRQTRSAFRSRQLKELREEIEQILNAL